MIPLIEDDKRLIMLCKSMNHDDVIKCIMNDEEVKGFIIKLTSNKDTATQIMHDTVLSFIRSCMREDFQFQKKPIAYIKSIAKYINIKLSKIEIQNSKIRLDYDSLNSATYEVNYDLKEILDQLLSKISIDCQEVLELWAMKYRMKEIAKTLNYSSEGYAKKKKHLCLKKLISVVDRNSKLMKELRLYV